MTHNQLQKLVSKRLTVKGNGFSIVSSNRRGRPDIVGHIGIVGIAVECKVGKDKLRPAQRATLLDICDKGGIGIVVHEKHLEVFDRYISLIERQIKANSPCNLIGKPIPSELEVLPDEKVAKFTI